MMEGEEGGGEEGEGGRGCLFPLTNVSGDAPGEAAARLLHLLHVAVGGVVLGVNTANTQEREREGGREIGGRERGRRGDKSRGRMRVGGGEAFVNANLNCSIWSLKKKKEAKFNSMD